MCSIFSKGTQLFNFIKSDIIWKLTYEVKYIILQIHGDFIINTKKEHNQYISVFKVFKKLSYYLNLTDLLTIQLIFLFLSCYEKAHDNKAFPQENLKSRCLSQIMTHFVKPCEDPEGYAKWQL